MSQAPAKTKVPEIDSHALKIVLFGKPQAGKSSLLGALMQGFALQPDALRGDFEDTSGGLRELQEEVYTNRTMRTQHEVVPYPIKYQPLSGLKSENTKILLVDCDGDVADTLLAHSHALPAGPWRKSPLAKAIINADTILLVMDVAATEQEIDANFRDFAKFLKLLEQNRSSGNEVSGLPVYLVLTKCDLLLNQGDSFLDWQEHIEDKKRKFEKKLNQFLSTSEGKRAKAFGKLHVHIWGTAIKRPSPSSSKNAPDQPYQVVELFRQVLASALKYRNHRDVSQRRLQMTVAGAIGLLGVMLLFALIFLATQNTTESALLEGRIKTFFTTQGKKIAPQIYSDAPKNLESLKELKTSPAYPLIPNETRNEVETWISRLRAYLQQQEKVVGIVTKYNSPLEINRLQRLNQLKTELENVKPSDELLEQWRDTTPEKVREQWNKQIGIIEKGIETAKTKYANLIDKGKVIDELSKKKDFTQAIAKSKELLPDVLELEKELKDQQSWVDDSEQVRWNVIHQYDVIRDLRDDWKSVESKIDSYLNIARQMNNN